MAPPIRNAAVEKLFAPVEVRSYSSVVNADTIDELLDEERVALAPMAAARQAEFATARACARSAMADHGITGPVVRSDGGAPLWPQGASGSISHTKGYCVAVATTARVSLGIDVELIDRMKPAIERRILVDAERAALGVLSDDERRLQVATIFAAKEAFYKAHYEIEPRYLGFDVVEVAIANDIISYQPSSGDVAPDVLTRTRGRLLVDQGRVTVGVVIS